MPFPKHKRGDSHMYDECPHCDVTQAGEHHTSCPNYSPGSVQVVVNTLGWERCVTAYLYPEAWGVWLDRAPVPLFSPRRHEMWDDLETL